MPLHLEITHATSASGPKSGAQIHCRIRCYTWIDKMHSEIEIIKLKTL